jgi:hypothetical protein
MTSNLHMSSAALNTRRKCGNCCHPQE